MNAETEREVWSLVGWFVSLVRAREEFGFSLDLVREDHLVQGNLVVEDP